MHTNLLTAAAAATHHELRKVCMLVQQVGYLSVASGTSNITWRFSISASSTNAKSMDGRQAHGDDDKCHQVKRHRSQETHAFFTSVTAPASSSARATLSCP